MFELVQMTNDDENCKIKLFKKFRGSIDELSKCYFDKIQVRVCMYVRMYIIHRNKIKKERGVSYKR